jgi:hypothetical protein
MKNVIISRSGFMLMVLILSIGIALLINVHNETDVFLLAKRSGVVLEPGIPNEVGRFILTLRIDVDAPTKGKVFSARGLGFPIGSGTEVEGSNVFFHEERLMSVRSNGFLIRLTESGYPLPTQQSGCTANGENTDRHSYIIFFPFGQKTETNVFGWRVIGEFN